MKPRARCCERSPGAASARSAAELCLPPLPGWMETVGKAAGVGMDWTAARSVPVCLCVCGVRACGALDACACIYGSRGNLCSAQRWSSLRSQAGRNPGDKTQRGRAAHAHTHTHAHIHTLTETCYTLHRRNTEYGSRKQILEWIAVCWQKEGKALSAPKTSSSPQTQLVLDPKLQIAF